MFSFSARSIVEAHYLLSGTSNRSLFPNTLAFLTSYFEHAVTSAITSRWFLSFRKVLLVFDDHSVSSRSAPRAISIEVSHTTFELPERSRTIPFSPNRERQKLQPISEADYPW